MPKQVIKRRLVHLHLLNEQILLLVCPKTYEITERKENIIRERNNEKDVSKKKTSVKKKH